MENGKGERERESGERERKEKESGKYNVADLSERWREIER